MPVESPPHTAFEDDDAAVPASRRDDAAAFESFEDDFLLPAEKGAAADKCECGTADWTVALSLLEEMPRQKVPRGVTGMTKF